MERTEKQTEIDLLNKSFESAQIALCADYRGLTVAQITKLRRQLRGSGLEGRVVKNTLAKIAAKRVLKDSDGTEMEKFLELFKGPSFVVFSRHDPVAPAKMASEFGKENEAFKIKGAWFEGAFVDVQGVKALASMPSREETLAKLLALIAAPATQLVRVLQAPAAQVVRVLEACRQKLEGKGS